MSLRELCHCGHDRLSHALDPDARPGATGPGGARADCLAMGCGCTGYVNEWDPPPRKQLTRPWHIASCECARCREYAESLVPPDRKTDPMGLP